MVKFLWRRRADYRRRGLRLWKTTDKVGPETNGPRLARIHEVCQTFLELDESYLVVPAKTPQHRRRNGLRLKLLA